MSEVPLSTIARVHEITLAYAKNVQQTNQHFESIYDRLEMLEAGRDRAARTAASRTRVCATRSTSPPPARCTSPRARFVCRTFRS